jgi:hypothetical protein
MKGGRKYIFEGKKGKKCTVVLFESAFLPDCNKF